MKIVDSTATILNKDTLSDAIVCKRLERVARTCYQSGDKITEDSYRTFVKKLLTAKHFGIFEHQDISISITTSRAIANELVRHRLASYAQESTRYVRYDNLEFVYNEFYLTPEQETLMEDSLQVVESLYLNLLNSGMTPQFARNILPLCTKTEIVITANIRSWMHMLAIRTAVGVHPEMIQLMSIVLDELVILLPTIFGRFDEWKDYV
jgi:thymidylate synthase (FAD)